MPCSDSQSSTSTSTSTKALQCRFWISSRYQCLELSLFSCGTGYPMDLPVVVWGRHNVQSGLTIAYLRQQWNLHRSFGRQPNFVHGRSILFRYRIAGHQYPCTAPSTGFQSLEHSLQPSFWGPSGHHADGSISIGFAGYDRPIHVEFWRWIYI